MKAGRPFLLGSFFIVALFLISSCGGDSANIPFQNITVFEASTIIQTQNIILLDVRTQSEFNQRHIAGAILIDYYQSTFKDDLNTLDKQKTYVIYCRTGRRSSAAMIIMQTLGFTKVYNVLGGIEEWEKQGFPTVS